MIEDPTKHEVKVRLVQSASGKTYPELFLLIDGSERHIGGIVCVDFDRFDENNPASALVQMYVHADGGG